jgi:hypothetical protein
MPNINLKIKKLLGTLLPNQSGYYSGSESFEVLKNIL